MVWFFLVSLEVASCQAFQKEKWGHSHPQEQAFHSSKHLPLMFFPVIPSGYPGILFLKPDQVFPLSKSLSSRLHQNQVCLDSASHRPLFQ